MAGVNAACPFVGMRIVCTPGGISARRTCRLIIVIGTDFPPAMTLVSWRLKPLPTRNTTVVPVLSTPSAP